MDILENTERNGNFTSSEIVKLVGCGKREMTPMELLARPKSGVGSSTKTIEDVNILDTVALTYIKEKNIERRLNLSLKQEVSTRPMAWGHLMEIWVGNNHLDYDYTSLRNKTFSHPNIDFWKGSPDHKNDKKSIVCDTKAYERKAFADYADCIMADSYPLFKELYPQQCWQLVSNSIILNVNFIQPIAFMPYQSELSDIRLFLNTYDEDDQWKYKYIYEALDNQLPYLMDDGYYKNMVTNIFEVPQADKDYLTAKVLSAGKYLEPFFITEPTTK